METEVRHNDFGSIEDRAVKFACSMFSPPSLSRDRKYTHSRVVCELRRRPSCSCTVFHNPECHKTNCRDRMGSTRDNPVTRIKPVKWFSTFSGFQRMLRVGPAYSKQVPADCPSPTPRPQRRTKTSQREQRPDPLKLPQICRSQSLARSVCWACG